MASRVGDGETFFSEEVKTNGKGCCGKNSQPATLRVVGQNVEVVRKGKSERIPAAEIVGAKTRAGGMQFEWRKNENVFLCPLAVSTRFLAALDRARAPRTSAVGGKDPAGKKDPAENNVTTSLDISGGGEKTATKASASSQQKQTTSSGNAKGAEGALPAASAKGASPRSQIDCAGAPKIADGKEPIEEPEEEEEEGVDHELELKELLEVAYAMRADLDRCQAKLREAGSKGASTETQDNNIKIIVAGSEHLCTDLEEVISSAEKWAAGQAPNGPIIELMGRAKDVVVSLRKLQEDPESQLRLSAQSGADVHDVQLAVNQGGAVAIRKDGQLDDITQYLSSDPSEIDQSIRTIVHGFENKVRPGEIGRVLKPKNEKNWMLLEVMGKEAHWVPSWVTSKGYYKVAYRHENVCKPGEIVEYLKGPMDGWLLLRNVTRKSLHADWAPVDCLPDEAFETKPKSVKKADTFAAFHDYEETVDGEVVEGHRIHKGDELQFLSGPINGWIYVKFLSTKQRMYSPYWVLPHGLRPTEDQGHAAKQKRGSAQSVN